MITAERDGELKTVTGICVELTCPRCNGNGMASSHPHEYQACFTCRGRKTTEETITLDELHFLGNRWPL